MVTRKPILYEKANLHEQTLKAGELAVRQKEEDIRMLKLQLVELQRQVMVTRKQLPRMPALAHAVVRLQAELKGERRATEALCRELESPSNSGRWKNLPGDDPDREQLLAKTAVLDERLNAKKEVLPPARVRRRLELAAQRLGRAPLALELGLRG